ncbi:MAG: Flp pilus assembly protein CpaB [Pseudooceanicola sp.]
MRIGSILVAFIGLGVAGGSAFLARDLIETRSANAAVGAESAVVYVIAANRDITFGQPIEGHMLTTIAWPRDAVPSGVFNDFDEVLPAAGHQPRRAKRSIAQGELLRSSSISSFGEKVTITQTLGPNGRAMAIKVNAETAVGGFVTPGDFVDIVLTQGRQETLRAVTILQNVRIIGVDQQSDERIDTPEVARTVTVEVTPEQGQKLALAQQAGTLSLTLRTLDSVADSPLESIRLGDLMRDVSPVPEDAPAKTVRVRRANVVTEQEVN